MTVHGDGRQTRTFVYIEDAIDAMMRLAFDPACEGETFNIGTSQEITMLELAKKIKEVGNFSSEIVFQPHREAYGESFEDIPRRVPDIGKVKKFVGWQAITSLEAGLLKTIEYYRDRRTVEVGS